jgi:hypothetical protein
MDITRIKRRQKLFFYLSVLIAQTIVIFIFIFIPRSPNRYPLGQAIIFGLVYLFCSYVFYVMAFRILTLATDMLLPIVFSRDSKKIQQ